MTQARPFFKWITAAALCSFLFTVIFVSCKKDETVTPADKSCLTTNIATAQGLYDGTTEGTKPGEYVVGSKAALKTVLDAAIAVNADANATQAAVTNSCSQLQAAIDTYNANLIQEIAAENLIGYWKMNGDATDASGNGNDGALTAGHAFFGAGFPTLTTDRFGVANMCYHFDKGGNIDVPYTSALNPPEMSISLWSKKSIDGRVVNPASYYMVAMNRWNGYKVQYQEANKIFFTVKVIGAPDTAIWDRDDETAVLNNDQWYHVVVTFKDGTMNFYVNGDLVKSWTNTPGTAITQAEPIDFMIGQDLPTDKYLTVDASGNFLVDYGGFFTGDLDDVMFYNIALDAPQVGSIYANQKP